MSIDHYIYVDNNPDYDVSTDFDGKELHENGVYIIEAGIEYLYSYQDPMQAVSDFEKWRRLPIEDIRLTLDGVVQPGERLPIDVDLLANVEEKWRRKVIADVKAAVEEAE